MKAVAAIDIGNTRAKFGLISDPALGPVGHVTATVLEQGQSLPDQLLAWWHNSAVGRACSCVIAGSDPDCRDQLLQHWPAALPKPLVIRSGAQIPVTADVDYPSKVGIDRLLNAYAAQFLLAPNQAAIIVDSGTATTVDLVTPGPVFRGGSILPGLGDFRRALHDYTARLPLVDVDESLVQLPSVPGRNTEDAIMAGLFLGQPALCVKLSQACRTRVRYCTAVRSATTDHQWRWRAAADQSPAGRSLRRQPRTARACVAGTPAGSG